MRCGMVKETNIHRIFLSPRNCLPFRRIFLGQSLTKRAAAFTGEHEDAAHSFDRWVKKPPFHQCRII